MHTLSSPKIAFMFGALFAFVHGVWSLLVMFGFAQPFLDAIYWLHFLNNPYRVETFSFTRAIMLVMVTFAMGYVAGWVIAHLWNMLHAPVHPKSRTRKQ